MLLANLKVSGLAKAERAAKEILEHIEAIKGLYREVSPCGINIELDLETDEAASGD